MRKIFVDTSAYFALANNKDANHKMASSIMHQLIRERAELTTTNFILAETHGFILNRIEYKTALRALDEIYKSQTRIYHVGEIDEKKALEIIRKHTDKEFSLIDAISFTSMERLHITEAFTFDRHFSQYGFTVL